MNFESKKLPLFLTGLVGIIILVVGAVFYFEKPTVTEVAPLTIAEGQQKAESLNPYLPKGYSIVHKAKRIDFPSGGTLFDTQLSNGTDKIGILMIPAQEFECEAETKQMGNRTLCINELGTTKSIKWTKDTITYEVISTSVDLPIEELEKIVDTIK